MKEIKNVAVYLGATMPADSSYTDAVIELGRYLARHNLTLVYGGSDEGTMRTLADALYVNGGKAIGVFTSQLPAEMLRPGLYKTYVAETLSERKAKMLELADAVIAMPGSYGTWDELFDALELAKIDMMHGKSPRPIGVLNIDGYFDGLLEFVRKSIEVGYTRPPYDALLKSAATVPELLDVLLAGDGR